MRRIKNPFAGTKEYNCFGCDPGNHDGLRMQFFEDGDEVVSFWEPQKQFEGYPNILHGGIQATLMDEVCAWAVYIQGKTAGVTVKMTVDFQKPLRTDKGNIELRAQVQSMSERICTVAVKLFDGEGQVCSTGELEYFIYPPEVAAKKLHFPGVEAFFE